MGLGGVSVSSRLGYALAGFCLIGALLWVVQGEWIWAGVLLAAGGVNLYFANVNRKAGS